MTVTAHRRVAVVDVERRRIRGDDLSHLDGLHYALNAIITVAQRNIIVAGIEASKADVAWRGWSRKRDVGDGDRSRRALNDIVHLLGGSDRRIVIDLWIDIDACDIIVLERNGIPVDCQAWVSFGIGVDRDGVDVFVVGSSVAWSNTETLPVWKRDEAQIRTGLRIGHRLRIVEVIRSRADDVARVDFNVNPACWPFVFRAIPFSMASVSATAGSPGARNSFGGLFRGCPQLKTGGVNPVVADDRIDGIVVMDREAAQGAALICELVAKVVQR